MNDIYIFKINILKNGKNIQEKYFIFEDIHLSILSDVSERITKIKK